MTAGGAIGVGESTRPSVRAAIRYCPPCHRRNLRRLDDPPRRRHRADGLGQDDGRAATRQTTRVGVARLRRRHRGGDGPDRPRAARARGRRRDARRESAQLLEALAAPEPSVISAAASVVDSPAGRAAMTGPGVAVSGCTPSPALLATRFASPDEHRPAYGPSVEAFLADQAARREPSPPSIGAHVIDVDGLTPDEEVARAIDALGSIEP